MAALTEATIKRETLNIRIKQVEVVFLIIDKPEQKKSSRRFPHRDIAGKMRIMGNIFDTASEKDWNLPK